MSSELEHSAVPVNPGLVKTCMYLYCTRSIVSLHNIYRMCRTNLYFANNINVNQQQPVNSRDYN